MQRYFALNITKDSMVCVSDEDAHHILHVMRNKVSDHIEVVFNKNLYDCEIKSSNPLEIKVISKIDAISSELDCDVTLFFALSKKDKIELVVQKATELGASKIVLISTKRCVTDFSNKDLDKKLERYYKIAKEASEQSHRLKIPEVSGVYSLKDIKPLMCEYNLLAYEKCLGNIGESFNNISKFKSISIMIGSEGGFDEEEVNYLNSIGFKNVSLGKRILRCETAAIYSMSVIANMLEK